MAEPKKQHYIIIGMGSFGAALARRLSSHGARITGLDGSREKISDLSDVLYEPVIGNATERSTLEHLALADATAVIISLGEDITQSLLATLHCRDLGAKRIIVKGVTHEHGQILKSLGASRVIFPEAEIAESLADRLIRPNIVDFLPLSPDYSFVEIAVPDTLIGKTLQEIDIRKRFSVWVLGVKDALSGELEMFPGGDYKLKIDQFLLVIGKQTAIDAMRDLG